MKMGNYFTKKEQIVILIIAFIIIVTLGLRIIMKDMIKSEDKDLEIYNLIEDDENQLKDNENHENSDIINSGIIMVHISGQVYNPGLVELELGDRTIDAVELAGGLKEDADLDKINLAKKLVDEEKIYIPKIGEENSENMDFSSQPTAPGGESTDKININNCTKEELMTLPGIGPALADRVIQYRETNLFKMIEDLMNVSGIGEKRFEALKDLIKTN